MALSDDRLGCPAGRHDEPHPQGARNRVAQLDAAFLPFRLSCRHSGKRIRDKQTTFRGMIPAVETKAPLHRKKKRRIHCVLHTRERGTLLQSWLLAAWISSRLCNAVRSEEVDSSSINLIKISRSHVNR